MDELTRLLLAAGSGDRAALTRFVEATRHDVWRFCVHLIDRDSADDLVQDTYVRAMRSAPRFRGDASAKTWLLTIARRVAADEIRRRQRRRRLPRPAERIEPDHAGTIELHDLIARLDHDRREAFVLTQLLELDYAQAATICRVPLGTIRSRVARARHDLLTMQDAAAEGSQAIQSPLPGM